MGKGWDPLGIELRNLDARFGPFSLDLGLGVVTGVKGVGSVAYVALQLAVWLGFSPIYFVGLDLHGPKFTGEGTGNLAAMDGLFRLARAALPESVRIYNCSPESRCTAFPLAAASS